LIFCLWERELRDGALREKGRKRERERERERGLKKNEKKEKI
jgi:hypothetical protein